MRWQGRRESSNVEDRRQSGGSLGGGKKSVGILGFIILLVGSYYGVDLSGLVGAMGTDNSVGSSSSLSTTEEQQLNSLARVVLADTESTWQYYFSQNGQRYMPPTMVLYSGATRTSCGTGQAAMGPFYCPNDQKVYLDLSFYSDMKNKLGATGDTAFAYVIAHEVGHHVQNLLGILPKVSQAQQQSNSKVANQLSVKLELQADCFAGVWGYQASQNNLLETGDLEEAFNAAEAVGDDRLQKRSQGYVIPDSFTHGTSAQRLAWFKRGLQSGDPSQCNSFN
ncbi:hypothetical protein EDC44_12315 [Cricetibacter osteomyelitidis]|uniref:Neutral zinc metallopeptidase n=1 Tax=Cricetibacter osteomyelitidis TaxID=1521931 RepID=A0A4R2SVB3_9PAST|nr:neutral zinc metallopeptidase [Cricetibacter osteomyelitidis]TCP93215.1 hypothetical protein EDC44_12315 [Cricetibacter osteomyelitidis]